MQYFELPQDDEDFEEWERETHEQEKKEREASEIKKTLELLRDVNTKVVTLQGGLEITNKENGSWCVVLWRDLEDENGDLKPPKLQ